MQFISLIYTDTISSQKAAVKPTESNAGHRLRSPELRYFQVCRVGLR